MVVALVLCVLQCINCQVYVLDVRTITTKFMFCGAWSLYSFGGFI